MPNMSYCRFENTLSDLEDCRDVINDVEDLSDKEKRCRAKLIEVCKDILEETGEEEN